MPLPPEYDPLLAKLMVHAEDRPAAVARLRPGAGRDADRRPPDRPLFHRWLVDEPGSRAAPIDTGLIPERWARTARR